MFIVYMYIYLYMHVYLYTFIYVYYIYIYILAVYLTYLLASFLAVMVRQRPLRSGAFG